MFRIFTRKKISSRPTKDLPNILQDSVVLRKLNFHKALGNGKFRLPKIRHNTQETYESLYKVGKLIKCMSDKRPI